MAASPAAGLDEPDLVRVEAVHGRRGQLAAGRAGRVGLIHRIDAGVQRRMFGMHLGQGSGELGGRDVADQDLHGHRAGDAVQMDDVGRAR